MPIIKKFSVVECNALAPGALFVFEDPDGGRAVAIAGQHTQDGVALHAVVLSTTTQQQTPYQMHVRLDDCVISYGADWVFDLGSADRDYVGNVQHVENPGSVILSRDGTLVIKVGPYGTMRRTSGGWFDLSQFEYARRTSDLYSAVIVRDWRIWIDEAERTRVGGTPLIVFSG